MAKQDLILVAAPRSGMQVLIKTLTADSGWSFSNELANQLTKSDSSTEVAAAEDSVSAGVSMHYHPDFALSIADLAKQHPTAKFIYLTRTPIDAIRSSLVGWRSQQFVTHTDLSGWWGDPWSFTLVPNWEDLIGLPIPEVAANQWLTIAENVIHELKELPDDRYAVVCYEEVLLSPSSAIEKLSKTLNLDWKAEVQPGSVNHANEGLANSRMFNRTTVEVAEVLNRFAERLEKFNQFRMQYSPEEILEEYRRSAAVNDDATLRREITRSSTDTPFSYKHSASVYELLRQAKSSIALTTYKSGHLIFVRADTELGNLNCAFKGFNKPMGVAVAGNRLALGTLDSLMTFTNQSAISPLLKAEKTSDVVYFPRSSVNTGDISIHEMAYGLLDGNPELWFVNTRFSCLAKMDLAYSFEPIWRPKWITELAAEDRCHLNGLALVDHKPKYVTALSQTNTPFGWREHKGTSGVIVDIETDEIIAEGLAMPHSPKWYDGKLWVLESGKGTIATVDIYTGEVTTIATLPGFTRGLSFIGNYALVGLSQVRESVFSELPVTQTKDERNCGVWVVDIRTGNVVGVLKFDGVVQEIFDVTLMSGAQWPRLETSTEFTQSAFVLSDEALKSVKATTSENN